MARKELPELSLRRRQMAEMIEARQVEAYRTPRWVYQFSDGSSLSPQWMRALNWLLEQSPRLVANPHVPPDQTILDHKVRLTPRGAETLAAARAGDLQQ